MGLRSIESAADIRTRSIEALKESIVSGAALNGVRMERDMAGSGARSLR